MYMFSGRNCSFYAFMQAIIRTNDGLVFDAHIHHFVMMCWQAVLLYILQADFTHNLKDYITIHHRGSHDSPSASEVALKYCMCIYISIYIFIHIYISHDFFENCYFKDMSKVRDTHRRECFRENMVYHTQLFWNFFYMLVATMKTKYTKFGIQHK